MRCLHFVVGAFGSRIVGDALSVDEQWPYRSGAMEDSTQRPASDHLSRPWRVHALASDFELLDVWRFALRGDERDFPSFLGFMSDTKALADSCSAPARALFALRLRLGRAFGWDRERAALPIPGCSETSLRDRLPDAHERVATRGGAEFALVYEEQREALLELSNSTCHALMHLGWVSIDAGGYAGQMAVYVKHRGRAGRAYMGLIEPFRRWVVYPALTAAVARQWQTARP